MELLLILIYVSLCYFVFKVFKIPVNQWSLATAALGGIIGIALLLLIMNYNHPFTTNARIYFAVTPVLPAVRGRVIEVPVETNKPLKEGDVLFRIDPKPYGHGLGAEFIDVNGDGRPDLYFTSNLGSDRLYLNRGDSWLLRQAGRYFFVLQHGPDGRPYGTRGIWRVANVCLRSQQSQYLVICCEQ